MAARTHNQLFTFADRILLTIYLIFKERVKREGLYGELGKSQVRQGQTADESGVGEFKRGSDGFTQIYAEGV